MCKVHFGAPLAHLDVSSARSRLQEEVCQKIESTSSLSTEQIGNLIFFHWGKPMIAREDRPIGATEWHNNISSSF